MNQNATTSQRVNGSVSSTQGINLASMMDDKKKEEKDKKPAPPLDAKINTTPIYPVMNQNATTTQGINGAIRSTQGYSLAQVYAEEGDWFLPRVKEFFEKLIGKDTKHEDVKALEVKVANEEHAKACARATEFAKQQKKEDKEDTKSFGDREKEADGK